MTSADTPADASVVAHVVLRGAAGPGARDPGPITAATMAAHRPPAGAQATAAGYFDAAGFAVTAPNELMLTLRGTVEQFEQAFGVVLRRAEDGTYRAAPSGTGVDPTSLPVTDLDDAVRPLISVVALEAAMTVDDTTTDDMGMDDVGTDP